MRATPPTILHSLDDTLFNYMYFIKNNLGGVHKFSDFACFTLYLYTCISIILCAHTHFVVFDA